MSKYTNWPLIGYGEERYCYLNPDDPTRIVKLSPADHATQTLREIRYFSSLIKKGIPFDFIPRYYGEIRDEKEWIGIEQEYIAEAPGSTVPAPPIDEYVKTIRTPEEIEEFKKAYYALKDYMLQWNIIPANLAISNVVISKLASGGVRAVIVDGVGGTEAIPLANWFRYFGKQKIMRKWEKLTRKLNNFNPKLKLVP